ncbi:hypothetical protein JCM10450v2_005785 [Rhodotorula kratochvilovae]
MTPTSPTSVGTTSTLSAPRPPARNKSSSALSTHTLRSLSAATSSGKPRRNKSSSSLAGGHHSAGHHPVSFAHHRKNSHGAHAMRRQGSASGSQRKAGAGAFGLGMTSMPASAAEGDDEAHEREDAHDDDADEHHAHRPDLGPRRTSSSSTATVVASDRGGRSSERGRSRSRSRARQEADAEAEATAVEEQTRRRERGLRVETDEAQREGKGKTPESGSVTSTSDWESATDSPLAIGKKLPQVEHSQPEGYSALAQALDERGVEAEAEPDEPEEQLPARTNGKKAKFSLGAASEDVQSPEEFDRQPATALDEDHPPTPQEGVPPPAASSPTATALRPAMAAVIEAVTPAAPLKVPPKPEPEAEQEAAGLAAPAPPTAPQHLSPPDTSPLNGEQDAEPSLAAAAQPELAFPNKPPSNPPSQPPSEPPTREPSRSAHFRPEPRKPNSPPRPPSPIRPTPHRVHPVRKSSNASILSGASTRSHLGRPAPHFRRSASHAPTLIDRGTTAHAELTSPGPDSSSGGGEAQRRSVVGEQRGGGRHQRGESTGSMRSLQQAADATAGPARRAQTLGPADAQRIRVSEPHGTALAKLGTIAAQAQASRATPPLSSSAGASGFDGALTHAKRSASGYFNALRGFTGLPPSTPPLSPSAGTGTAQRPIPGAAAQSSTSYGRASRARSSPSPRQPPLIVKFVEPTPPPPPPSTVPTPAPTPSPAPQRPLSAQHRTASSASLGPMSRTQQKALLARDAPQAAGPGSALAPPAQGPGVPVGLTPAQQQFLLLQQQRAAASASASAGGSAAPSPAPAAAAAVANGMQKWAFGLVREAERIERQYRAVEKWRDPLGESLERVLVVRQRARRRREDDRERVRAVIAAQQAATAASGASTPEPGAVVRTQTLAQGGGAATPGGALTTKGKQRAAAHA